MDTLDSTCGIKLTKRINMEITQSRTTFYEYLLLTINTALLQFDGPRNCLQFLTEAKTLARSEHDSVFTNGASLLFDSFELN